MRRPQDSWLTFAVRRYFPWVVIDPPLVWLCYALALLARGTTADVEYAPALMFGLLASAIVVACNQAFGIYRRWWRYATSQDLVPLVSSVASATVIVVGADLGWPGSRPMPLSAVFLGGFFSLAGMTAVRYRTKPLAAVRRTWRRLITPPHAATKRVLIIGAGDAGQLLGWQLQNGPHAEGHHLVGFVDDDRRKHGMLIHGRNVLGDRTTIPRLVETHQVDLIVLAIHQISGRDFRDIVSICQETPAQIQVLPNVYGTIRGDPDVGHAPAATRGSLFGDVTLEDLLGRHSVSIDRDQCRHLVRGKTVLVTGASGSIGSELCRQLADLRPARLLMLDSNESGLHDLGVELQGYRSDDTSLIPIIADVTHEDRMRSVFEQERPSLVFHTAAYKHVPLMEDYPEEAVRVNVGGTVLVTKLAAEYRAERFVLVSSDKAVEPSSVMGATKRVCELVAGAVPSARTLFTSVRFGNVLASRGSVVPTFGKQIDMGGPVTITDPSMQRYFMSVAEASSLVIQAASYTRGGDIFILDMGEEINVADLARRMIRLRGLRPEIDIPIVVTGARPGEKLREILTSADESKRATPHPQVFRVEGGRARYATAALTEAVSALLGAARQGDRGLVRQRLWALTGAEVGEGRAPLSRPTGGGRELAFQGSGAGGGASAGVVTPTRPLTPDPPPPGPSLVGSSPDPEPPMRVLANRARGALAESADRVIAWEPFYGLPALVLLLAYPHPLVFPSIAVLSAPWVLRWIRTGRPTAATPFDVPIGLFLAGACVGLFATTNELWAGVRLSGILAGIALFYIIVNHATGRRSLQVALFIALAAAGVGCVVLLFLAAPYLSWGAGSGPWQPAIAATDGVRRLLLEPAEALERYRVRASGVGGLATFGLALAVGPSLAGSRRSVRMAGYALTAFFGLVVLLSGSRGSLVSVTALAVALLGLRNGWFLAAVPAVLVGLWAILERGLFGLGAPDALPLTVKMTFWRNAASMLHDFALTGAGLGLRSVRDLYEAYFLSIGPSFSHAHNAFIQAYLEQGILGCAGLVGLTATVFFYGRRAVAKAHGPLAWGTALSAAGAATVLIFEALTEVFLLTSVGSVMLFTALGLLVAAARLGERAEISDKSSAEESSPRPTARWRQPRVATPVVAGIALVVAAMFAFTPLGASAYLNLGSVERARAELPDEIAQDERDRRLASAEVFLRQGVAVDEGDPALWRGLAEIAIARNDDAEAESLLHRAGQHTPSGDGYGWFQLGRLYGAAGLWREAIRSWREAGADDALRAFAADFREKGQWERASAALLALIELRPSDARAYRDYAEAATASPLGREGTIQALERLGERSARSPWPHVERAILYESLGRRDEAEAARRQAAALGATEGRR